MSTARKSSSKHQHILDEGYDALIKEGNYAKALGIFKSIQDVAQGYELVEALYGIASCQSGLKHYEEAITALKKLMRNPVGRYKQSLACCLLVGIYIKQQRWEDAEKALVMIKEGELKGDRYFDYLAFKVKLLQRKGRNNEALSIVDAQLSRPNFKLLKAEMLVDQGEYKAAALLLKQVDIGAIKDLSPKRLLTLLLKKQKIISTIADERIKAELLKESRSDFEAMRKRFPKNPQLSLAYARALAGGGEDAELVDKVYVEVEKAFPDFWDLWQSHAVFLHKQGNFKESIPLLHRITNCNKYAFVKPTHPELTNAHVSLAIAYFELGEKSETFKEVDNALKFDPNSAAAYSLLGKLHSGSNEKLSREYFDRSKALDAARWNKKHPALKAPDNHVQSDAKGSDNFTVHVKSDAGKLPRRALNNHTVPATASPAMAAPETKTARVNTKPYQAVARTAPAPLQFVCANPFDALSSEARKKYKERKTSDDGTQKAKGLVAKKASLVRKAVHEADESRPLRCSPCDAPERLYANAHTLFNRGYGYVAKRASVAKNKLSESATAYLQAAQQNAEYYFNKLFHTPSSQSVAIKKLQMEAQQNRGLRRK